MKTLRAHFQLTCVVELPDDEHDADTAFDGICDGIVGALQTAVVPHTYPASFAMIDADTREEADDA